MIVTSLDIENFRSYKKLALTFSPKVTLIVGENGSGKTNILEALMLVATGKSFRATHERDVVLFDREMAKVAATVNRADGAFSLSIYVTRGFVQGVKTPLKKYLVNRIARRGGDFVGTLKVVLFWPQDLELVTDSPSMRRRYLDAVLSQTDVEYRRCIVSYEKGLRQRNMLLDRIFKQQATRSQLVFWDQLLIKAGDYITRKREEYLLYTLNAPNIDIHSFHAVYDPSRISSARLEQYASEEVAAKTTLVGPHRDDFHILMETSKKNIMVNVKDFGSRGEQRSAVLWLKCIEASYIEHVFGERPVLLLDDIFSEFDKKHRDIVRSLVLRQQTILTTADMHIAKELGEINIIRLPI